MNKQFMELKRMDIKEDTKGNGTANQNHIIIENPSHVW